MLVLMFMVDISNLSLLSLSLSFLLVILATCLSILLIFFKEPTLVVVIFSVGFLP